MSPPTRADLGREGNNGLGTAGALVALATGLAADFGGILNGVYDGKSCDSCGFWPHHIHGIFLGRSKIGTVKVLGVRGFFSKMWKKEKRDESDLLLIHHGLQQRS